jgi:WD40 repeat protein
VYDIKTYQLQKLLTSQTSNITALKWEPVTERYLAQATLDKKIVLWDIQTEQVKFEVQLNSHANHIEWDFASRNSLLLVLGNGELKSIDLSSKVVS